MRRLTLTLSFLLLAAMPVMAQRTLVIERFDAQIVVDPDGSITVTETVRPRFTGSWNGIFRTVPIRYRTLQGFDWTIRLDQVSVTDGDGAPLEFETSRQRHYAKFKIWVPGAVDATRTVVLRYRVKNGLRFFEEHDELYWNVTGDEWEVPIEAAGAHIVLPGSATGVRAISFNGPYGSTSQDAEVLIDGTDIRITMPHRLEFHQGLTAVIGWDKGVVREPTQTEKATAFLVVNWPLMIPFFTTGSRTWEQGNYPVNQA